MLGFRDVDNQDVEGETVVSAADRKVHSDKYKNRRLLRNNRGPLAARREEEKINKHLDAFDGGVRVEVQEWLAYTDGQQPEQQGDDGGDDGGGDGGGQDKEERAPIDVDDLFALLPIDTAESESPGICSHTISLSLSLSLSLSSVRPSPTYLTPLMMQSGVKTAISRSLNQFYRNALAMQMPCKTANLTKSGTRKRS
eukprot:TRINITY_DN1373_c0_g1_i8.p1 TRINITY_DN1373_c0_g1~~TRINITY_DN1373_c0_g1_i8.p1  ORF type:complete len:197 (+),score=42.16 TRINITY_DN1373_c0_g1_i8:344-934(+)